MANFKTYFNDETNSIRLCDSQLTLEWLAVLSAKDIHYYVNREDNDWIIELDAADYDHAVEELSSYENERGFFDILKRKRESRIQFNIQRSGTSIIIGLLLILFYVVSGAGEYKSDFHQTGTLNTFKVYDGEWWRLVTALTLHADVPHILGNTIFLIIFASSACFSMGTGFAWLFIVLSGLLGNLLTIYTVYPANHCAIGASTAVFGALGIIGAYRVTEKLVTRRFHYTSLIPLLAVIGVFAITGSSQSSDYRAHFMGFAVGISFGCFAYFVKLEKLKENYVLQLIPFALAVAIVAYSWYLAMGVP